MFAENLNIPLFANVPFSLLFEKIKLFREFGVFPEIYFDSDTFESLKFENADEIRSVLYSSKMMATIHAPFWDLSLGSTDAEIRRLSVKRIVTAINIAKSIGAQNVVFHSGFNSTSAYARGKGEWIKNLVDSVGQIIEYSKSFSVPVSMENVYDADPEVFLALKESFSKGQLRFCFDTGHFNVFSKVPIEEWIGALSPFINEVHVHGNSGRDDEHLSLDCGNFDFEKFFRLLVDAKAAPIVTIENKVDDYLVRSVKVLRSEKFLGLLNNFRREFAS